MRANVCYVDMSGSQLGEGALMQAIDLLKMCSHKLKVIVLDGNVLSERVLERLADSVIELGLKQIERISMSRCGLVCKCKDLRSDPSCPISLLLNFLTS